MLTLTEAAKETGVSRTAIFNAIKRGRLSATKNAQGNISIDPAELFRVYAPVNKVNINIEQNETTKLIDVNTRIEMMTQLLDMKDQLIKQVEGERDDLRRRLDEESRKVAALLTYQPEKTEAPPPIQSNGQPEDSPLWWKLFGRR